MRVAIYDKCPGEGPWQAFLALTWRIGCLLHRVFGYLDEYHAATSWEDAFKWLETRKRTLNSVQYWGHGSPGVVYLAGTPLNLDQFKRIQDKVLPDTVIWFRTCSTFQGLRGFDFSKRLTDMLKCHAAGHTRIIGVFQGGLHTRKYGQYPSWPEGDGEYARSWMTDWGLIPGNNAVFCLRATIPPGW